LAARTAARGDAQSPVVNHLTGFAGPSPGHPPEGATPTAISGIKINTSPTDFRPYQQMQLGKFNGKNFEPFGDVIGD